MSSQRVIVHALKYCSSRQTVLSEFRSLATYLQGTRCEREVARVTERRPAGMPTDHAHLIIII